MEYKRQMTMYYDVQDSDQVEKDRPPSLPSKQTLYHEAQPIHLPDPTPRPARSKSRKGFRIFCCFYGSEADDVDESPISPPGIEEHGPHRKLSAIKEASLTREQIIRKQTEQGIVLDRSVTIYQSFSKSDHPDFGGESESEEIHNVGVQRKLSAAATFKKIVRTLTGQRPIELDDKALEVESGVSKPKLERKPTIVESMLNKLRRTTTGLSPTDPVLGDEEYEYLQKFSGIWYSNFEKNKPGNVEISKIMGLGWGLKKALDNVPFMEITMDKSTVKNTAKVFGLVDIREERPWSGTHVEIKRKDLRGMSTSWIERRPDGYTVHTEWKDPLAAHSSEELALDEAGNLVISVSIKRESGESCDLKLYFSRKK